MRDPYRKLRIALENRRKELLCLWILQYLEVERQLLLNGPLMPVSTRELFSFLNNFYYRLNHQYKREYKRLVGYWGK